MEEIILVGYGGHARSVADCIERQNQYHIFGYTDLQRHESRSNYLGQDDVLEDYYKQGIKNAVVCIGYLGKGTLREKLYSRLKSIGFTLPVIADPSSVISNTAKIGEGSFIGKAAIVNANAKIGKMAIINTSAIVEHDCVVEEYSHIAVGAVLCGTVNIGKGCLVGANATVLQTLNIGKYSVIAAGVTVRKSVPEESIVINGTVAKVRHIRRCGE